MTMAEQPENQPSRVRAATGTCSRRAVLSAAIAAGAYSFTKVGDACAVPSSPSLIVRGMSLPSWWNGTYRSPRYGESLAVLRRMGFNAVAVVPTHVVATASGSRIIDSAQSESFDDVAQAVELARGQGLQVLLRPHLGVADHAVSTQAIDPADKPAFFADYRALIAGYARLAERAGASFLAVGSELARLTGPGLRDSWMRVVRDARQGFSGPLVYAAAGGEAAQVSFWDALDYIGIEMCAATGPARPVSAQAIVRRWREAPVTADAAGACGRSAYVAHFRTLSRSHGKPILFTGVGVRSVTGAPATARDDGSTYTAADFTLQSAFYRALMQLASEENDAWLAGMFVAGWRIEADPKGQAWA